MNKSISLLLLIVSELPNPCTFIPMLCLEYKVLLFSITFVAVIFKSLAVIKPFK